MLDVKKQSEIRQNPIEDPHRIGVILDGETAKKLKMRALEMDTTAAEIIRALVTQYLQGKDNV